MEGMTSQSQLAQPRKCFSPSGFERIMYNLITCLAEISSDKTFEDERILIAVSSSKIFPYLEMN